jgi:hypothetical protein
MQLQTQNGMKNTGKYRQTLKKDPNNDSKIAKWRKKQVMSRKAARSRNASVERVPGLQPSWVCFGNHVNKSMLGYQ